MEQHITTLCEQKARAGDGLYAIAYGLLLCSHQAGEISEAIHQLGIAHAIPSAGGRVGAIEALAMKIEESSDQLGGCIEASFDHLSDCITSAAEILAANSAVLRMPAEPDGATAVEG